MINMVTSEDCDYKAKETEGMMNSQKNERSTDEKNVLAIFYLECFTK